MTGFIYSQKVVDREMVVRVLEQFGVVLEGQLSICILFGYKPCFPSAQRFWFVVLRYIEEKNHETNKDRRGSTSWVATQSFYESELSSTSSRIHKLEWHCLFGFVH